MTLGSSLRRRRGRRPSRGGGGPGRVRRLLPGLLVGGAALVGGFGVGYGAATLLLFPAPEGEPDRLVTVPDLRTLPLEAAVRAVEDSALAVGEVDTLGHPTAPRGSVVAQSPLPGQLAVPGGTVRVTVSGGPELRPVPDLRYLRLQDALVIARSWGFEVTVDSVFADETPGRIVAVDPPVGSEVPLPYRVRLVVSRGPALVPMPLLLALPETAAVARLDSLGLTVERVDRRPWPGGTPGTVVGQEPAAGTLVERGRGVRLTVVGPPPGEPRPPGAEGPAGEGPPPAP